MFKFQFGVHQLLRKTSGSLAAKPHRLVACCVNYLALGTESTVRLFQAILLKTAAAGTKAGEGGAEPHFLHLNRQQYFLCYDTENSHHQPADRMQPMPLSRMRNRAGLTRRTDTR